jgi:putative DNA primase/helicase
VVTLDPNTIAPMPDDGDDEPLDEPVRDDEPVRELYPSPSAPLDVARMLYRGYQTGDGLQTLLAWRGGWMHWQGPHWIEIDDAELRSRIYKILGEVDYKKPIKEKGEVVGYEITPWDPNKHKISDVLEAMAAVGHLSSSIDPPAKIVHSAVRAENAAGQLISCSNGLLNLSTRKVSDHTPALFNVVSVPFDYDAEAPEPKAWFKFLKSVWGDDTQSVALLQEYIGYVLSGRTDMQKMLLLIGPTRSGKGTITRMLAALIGRGHVAGPTLASLGTNFGLQPLLGRPLAIISDARLGSMPANTVVERLLSITGEDMLTVDRKYRDPWSGKLPTRFVILSNELPRFRDSSGAIANRLLILQMTKSFLGREDRTLDGRLGKELAGILNWALEGLDRLIENGRFTVPKSSDDATNLMMDLASPMSAFVRDCCVRDPQASVERAVLYNAYQRWCLGNGHRPGSMPTFGRDLHAVAPEVKVTQPRVDGGGRVRTYTYIGLLPVPPVPPRGDWF